MFQSEGPLISVIVPVYNVEQFLDNCVTSIVNQSYRNFELILVDDGSPDNCPRLCDEWAQKDSRIKVIHKKNGGLSDARNAGLNIVNGEYLLFVDSDDYIELDMLSILINIIKNYDPDVINFNYDRNNYILYDEMKFVTNLEMMEMLLEDKYITSHIWRNIYKKRVFDDMEFPKGKNFEDYAIAHALFYKCRKIIIINKVLYHYYDNQKGITKSFNEKLLQDFLAALFSRKEFISQHMPQLLAYFNPLFYKNIYYIRKKLLTMKPKNNDLISMLEDTMLKFNFSDVDKKRKKSLLILKFRHIANTFINYLVRSKR